MPLLFPFAPNWAVSVKHHRAFRTQVIYSRSFDEQRIAERTTARRRIEFTVSMFRRESVSFLAFLERNAQGVFDLPDWTRDQPTAEPVSLGSDRVPMQEPPFWLKIGQRLLLGSEVLTVEGFDGNDILTTTGVLRFWPAGTKVRPLLQGVLDQNIRGTLATDSVWTGNLSFIVDPGTFAETDGTAGETFNGRELWLKKPDWSGGLPLEVQGYLETVDLERGVVQHYSPVARNARRLQVGYVFGTRDLAESFLAFFNRCKGQRGEFYHPTWQPDLDLTLGASAGSSILNVPGLDFFHKYGTSAVFKSLILFYRDGTHVARRIASVTVLGANTRITITGTWPKAVNPTTVRLGSLLALTRFATDELTMEWETSHIAKCRTTFLTLGDVSGV